MTPMGTPFTDALDSQGVLRSGEQGWWKVWGASSRHVEVGDLVMLKWGEKFAEYEIAEVLDDDFGARKFRGKASDSGQEGPVFRIGALQPIALLRRGTHHTLAKDI